MSSGVPAMSVGGHHYGEMVPGESYFSLGFDGTSSSAAAGSDDQQQHHHTDHDKSAPAASLTSIIGQGVETRKAPVDELTVKMEDEDAESTDPAASLSPSSSVQIVNPESPDDSLYAPTGSGINSTTSAKPSRPLLPNGKKTKGRVKIKMEFIDNKLRRYTTFSKRKTGIMKKAYELSTLTGTQVMLLVASETGHVYTFATKKLQPMITSEAGKALIQTCLNSSDSPPSTLAGRSPSETMMESSQGALFTSTTTPATKSNGQTVVESESVAGLSSSSSSTSATSNRRSKLRSLITPTGRGQKLGAAQKRPVSQNYKGTSKPFSLVSSYTHDLPTMVTPVPLFTNSPQIDFATAAAFQSSDEGDEEIEDDLCSPSLSVGQESQCAIGQQRQQQQQQQQQQQKLCKAGKGAASSQSSPQNAMKTTNSSLSTSTSNVASGTTPVFSFTGLLPNNNLAASSQQQQSFGFIPTGIAPNGALMYQIPPGLVYAAPTTAMTTDINGQTQFMFAGFPASTSTVSDSSNAQQQQFITIPMPFTINPQSLLSAGLMASFSAANQATEDNDAEKASKVAE
ncbi:Serum response factor [Trichinella papuae]|uniref:Serum response factor homolog n=1 Tax=Trichinella papuae TaxID=268474 RepID=A0A0V1MZG1_9BILA|nr:Serum response factor [Trichinella papuae]